MIVSVNQSNIHDAAIIHSVSWQDSHRSFCSTDFIAMHTPEHQEAYLQQKIDAGSKVFMLIEQNPIGIVSLTDSMIEDLYVLPEYQNHGYGSDLLHFAISECADIMFPRQHHTRTEIIHAGLQLKFLQFLWMLPTMKQLNNLRRLLSVSNI